MDKYTIYCTEEQIKKALELGVNISEAMSRYNSRLVYDRIAEGKETKESYNSRGIAIVGKRTYKIPTAEQMISWLEEQNVHISVWHRIVGIDNWHEYGACIDAKRDDAWHNNEFDSRKEATLAAIDSALDYLIENKE